MVSQAGICLTKLLSSIIFLTLKERDKVTANGKPSGIATTIIVIQRIILWNISFHIPDHIE